MTQLNRYFVEALKLERLLCRSLISLITFLVLYNYCGEFQLFQKTYENICSTYIGKYHQNIQEAHYF